MDAKAQSDPCEEPIDPFVKTQFKPLRRYENVTHIATSDSTVKTLALEKKLAEHVSEPLSIWAYRICPATTTPKIAP